MKDGYIIWNTTTGIYDGAYSEYGMAIDRYREMSEEDPSGEWIIVQWTYGKKLSDAKFHARNK